VQHEVRRRDEPRRARARTERLFGHRESITIVAQPQRRRERPDSELILQERCLLPIGPASGEGEIRRHVAIEYPDTVQRVGDDRGREVLVERRKGRLDSSLELVDPAMYRERAVDVGLAEAALLRRPDETAVPT